MEDETPRRRGRPATPSRSPLGDYLRQRREARGWTGRELAKAVGLPITSASYISQLEAGSKAPNIDLAEKLAEQLGDEQGIFVLWAMTGRRSDQSRAVHARRQLARLLNDPSLAHDPHFTLPGLARIEAARKSLFWRRRAGPESEPDHDETAARPTSPESGTFASMEPADHRQITSSMKRWGSQLTSREHDDADARARAIRLAAQEEVGRIEHSLREALNRVEELHARAGHEVQLREQAARDAGQRHAALLEEASRHVDLIRRMLDEAAHRKAKLLEEALAESARIASAEPAAEARLVQDAGGTVPAQPIRILARLVSDGTRALRIPILPEGADPDGSPRIEALMGPQWKGDSLRLDEEAAHGLRLERPFAYRLTDRGVNRVTNLLQPGDVAVVTREVGPLFTHEVYAVRVESQVELSFVHWNGRQLLLLPDEGKSDFIVLPAGDLKELAGLLVGHLATVVRGAAESER